MIFIILKNSGKTLVRFLLFLNKKCLPAAGFYYFIFLTRSNLDSPEINFWQNSRFCTKQCFIIKQSPQRKIGITFCVVVRFWCPIAEMKATVMPLHMILDLSKNIYFSKSYSRKLFATKKTQLDFQKNIFKKIKKYNILFFRNFEIFDFRWLFKEKNRKSDFLKNQNCGFFWTYFFSENRVEFFWSQKVFGCNFSNFQYFLMILDAFDAQTTGLSNAPKNFKNGPVRKKLFPKNLGVVI